MFIVGIIFLLMSSIGCGSLLQSRRVAKPFAPNVQSDCKNLRTDLLALRKKLREQKKPQANFKLTNPPKEKCSLILKDLSIQEGAQNTKPISSPKEKLDLLLSSQLLLTAREALIFLETINNFDFLTITCREVEQTFTPGIGDGIAYADFYRTGEDFTTHLVCDNDDLVMVFPPDNGPIDEYERETILSLIGTASESAVEHGVKKAIP